MNAPKLEFARCALESSRAQPALPAADQRSAASGPSDVARATGGWIREVERLGRSFEDSGKAEGWRGQAPPQTPETPTDAPLSAGGAATATDQDPPPGDMEALNAELAEVGARPEALAPLGQTGAPQGNRQQFAAPGEIGETVVLPAGRPVAPPGEPGPPPTQPLPAWIELLTGGSRQ